MDSRLNPFQDKMEKTLNNLPERLQGGEVFVPLNCLHRPEET